ALASLAHNGAVNLTLDSARGLAGRFPLRSAALLLGLFSLAGLPLLSGFPFRILLVEGLAGAAPGAAAAVLLGSLGLLAAGLRVVAALAATPPPAEADALEETGPRLVQPLAAWLFLSLGALGSLLVGLFPHSLWPFFASLPAIFNQLGR